MMLTNDNYLLFRTGINCGKASNFKAETFDYVISTCALFGKGDSWKDILKTALYALKSDGALFLAEKAKKNNNPGVPKIDIYEALQLASVHCQLHRGFGSKEEKKTFLDYYLAMTCKKEEDYDSTDLLGHLCDIIRNV